MKHKKVFSFFGFLFLMTIHYGLFSQGIIALDSIEQDTVPGFSITAKPMMIYASKLSKAFPVSGINLEQINRADAPTIEPLLNRLPGIWMQTGALNTNRISIRGVGYQEPFATTGIKIYLDDIPLTNGAGESSIEDIHPFILSDIEVWRGPASAIWGAGLGGMIQLKTRIPDGKRWHTKIQVGSNNRMEFDQGLSLLYGKNKQWSTTLYYQYLHDDGYRENNDYNKHSFTWMQRWNPNSKMVLTTFFHGIDLTAFLPSSINKTMFDETPEKAAPQWIGVHANEDYRKWITGINFLWLLKSNMSYKATVFANIFQSDEVRPFNILEEGSKSLGTRHHFSIGFAPWGHLNIGMEYFRERADFSTFQTLEGGIPGIGLSTQHEIRSSVNGFIQSEFDINDKCVVFAGIHVNNTNLSGYSQEENFPTTFFPTVGSNLLISKNISISASISRGYSNVALSNLLSSTGLITPGIQLEKGWSEEAAITLGNPEHRFVRVGIYNLNMNNSIVTRYMSDGSFNKINAGKVSNRGAEAAYKYSFGNTFLDLQGSYTFQHNRNFVTQDHPRLPGYPSHRTFHEVTYTRKDWRGSISHISVSKVFLNDQLTDNGKGYQLLNLNLSYGFDVKEDWKFRVTGTLHNIFDAMYSSMYQVNAVAPNGALPRYYYPGKPRSFYLGVTMDYNFL